MTREKPAVCEGCKQDNLANQDCPHSFSHGDFWLCGICAHEMCQDIENRIRDDLGMSQDDPVTLG